MHNLNPKKVALTLGILLAGWHLTWSVLVLLGLAQPLINFILWAHMIHLEYIVGPFELLASATLIVLTFVSGYIFGYIGSVVWNKMHK